MGILLYHNNLYWGLPLPAALNWTPATSTCLHFVMSSPPLNGSGSRQSFDSDRVHSPPPVSNGTTEHEDLEGLDPVQRLQRELERTREEKDHLAAQYRNLLAKLTQMRTTLGNKLKQDAVRCTPFYNFI